MPWYKNADDVEKVLARAKCFGSVGVKVVFRSSTDGTLVIKKSDIISINLNTILS